MMSKQETYESIEAYLNGGLTGSELNEFEIRLQTDSELATQVDLFREMDEAIKDKAVLNFQDMVRAEGELFLDSSSSEKDKAAATPKRINLRRRYLAIAASFLVLILSALIYWNMQPGVPPSGSALFAQHFEAYNLNQSVRSEDQSIDVVFQSGVQQYQTQNYSAAANIFQQLADTNEQDMVLAFCLGSSYLNQQDPKLPLASQQFQKVIMEGNSIYVPRAKWYQALIHLKEGDLEKAKDLLKDVAKSKDSFGDKANTILKQL